MLGSIAGGMRSGMDMVFAPPTLCYYDVAARPGVQGYVALTLDDAPCSQKDSTKSMVPHVKALLAEFGAKATFFVISNFVPGHEASLRSLLLDGHELGNHCCEDRSYY